MKQLRIITIASLLVLLLSACGHKDEESKQTEKPKQETKTTEKDKAKAEDSKKEEKKENVKQETKTEAKTVDVQKTGPLTQEEIKHNVALMLLNPNLNKRFISGQEVLEGKYTGIMQGQTHTFKVNEIRLIKGKQALNIAGAPNGMDFYEVSPVCGPYVTYIGISREYVIIGGTQAAVLNYNDEINQGYASQFKVSDLEKQGISKAQVDAVASKIVLGNNERQPIIRLD
ncbi:hypothetical protein K2V61_10640 [Staphylococcus simulans]|uniref:hypothetical protein n=1 Tax=Staphylococcus simulans TaxID=1286 RepID=UPI001E425CDF|nr:hypothetical protein [Staphylococcus simulans]MCD8916003.1 hypothetical protein [Staphylococcus simulans]